MDSSKYGKQSKANNLGGLKTPISTLFGLGDISLVRQET